MNSEAMRSTSELWHEIQGAAAGDLAASNLLRAGTLLGASREQIAMALALQKLSELKAVRDHLAGVEVADPDAEFSGEFSGAAF